MDELRQDLRYAVRQVVRRPGFSLVVIATLALGVGANTAVFSVVEGVLLRPLPYPEPDRLMMVWTRFPNMDLNEFPASYPEYLEFREATSAFEDVGGFVNNAATLTGDDAPERLRISFTTASLFPVLRASAVVGRVFGEEEDVEGQDDVVILSHSLWQRRFGADRDIIGRAIELNGIQRTVLGVMPRSFRFPDRDIEAWAPLGIDPANMPGRASHFLTMVGRLAAGASPEMARAEVATLIAAWEGDHSLGHTWSRDAHPVSIVPLREQLVGGIRPALLVLLAAVGLVLLIACANIANLLLVRGEARRRELSVRGALGAGRLRLARQLVTESLVLAALGGVAGLVLAYAGTRLLLRLAPDTLPRVAEIGLNGPVLLYSLATTLAAGLLFGLAPAIQVFRGDLKGLLREGSRGATAGRSRLRGRQVLVVSEMALALVLLIAAGLLFQSFRRLHQVDPGFRVERVLAFNLALPSMDYPEGTNVTAFYRELLPRLRALAGVHEAGAVFRAPLGGSLPPNDIEIANRVRQSGDPPLNTDVQAATPGYFAAMNIPVIRGRVFVEADHEDAPPVAVINETLARRFWPDEDPIGHRIRQPGADREWATIVGIIGDVRHEGLATEPRGEFYIAHSQSPRTWGRLGSMAIVIRAATEPTDLTAAARRAVQEMDPRLALFDVRTMEQALAESTATERFAMLLQLIFALIALGLAAIGIYGVLAFTVAQRTNEIGIRLALGARREQILRLVVGQGMLLAATAAALGVVAAIVATRFMASLLFGITATDPVTFGTITAILLVIALLACWIPARRATRVDPSVALRYE